MQHVKHWKERRQLRRFLRSNHIMFLTGQVADFTAIQLIVCLTCWRQDWRLKASETSQKWRRLRYRPGRASAGKIPSVCRGLWVVYWSIQFDVCARFLSGHVNLSNQLSAPYNWWTIKLYEIPTMFIWCGNTSPQLKVSKLISQSQDIKNVSLSLHSLTAL